MKENLSHLILASASPRRLALLEQMGLRPEILVPTEIDETPKRRELPRSLAVRLARAKVEAAMSSAKIKELEGDCYLLAADTVVAVGRRIIPKPEIAADAAEGLKLLSGRSHRVYTAISIIAPNGKHKGRVVETRVRFKRLSRQDLESYISTGEWRDKAGGYAIQGRAEAFVMNISGSYSNVVGLPLYDTVQLLMGLGYPVYFDWLNPN